MGRNWPPVMNTLVRTMLDRMWKWLISAFHGIYLMRSRSFWKARFKAKPRGDHTPLTGDPLHCQVEHHVQ